MNQNAQIFANFQSNYILKTVYCFFELPRENEKQESDISTVHISFAYDMPSSPRIYEAGACQVRPCTYYAQAVTSCGPRSNLCSPSHGFCGDFLGCLVQAAPCLSSLLYTQEIAILLQRVWGPLRQGRCVCMKSLAVILHAAASCKWWILKQGFSTLKVVLSWCRSEQAPTRKHLYATIAWHDDFLVVQGGVSWS